METLYNLYTDGITYVNDYIDVNQFKTYPYSECKDESRFEDAYNKDVGRSIRNGIFAVLMFIKVFNTWYIMTWTINKYRITQGTWHVPEIRLIGAQLLKTTMLLVAYFMQEMNTLYAVYLLNSICTYWLQWMLAMRACVCLELDYSKVRMTNIIFLLQFGIYASSYFIMPFFAKFIHNNMSYYEYFLTCDKGEIYRKSYYYLKLFHNFVFFFDLSMALLIRLGLRLHHSYLRAVADNEREAIHE